MGQFGFFDADKRLAALSAKGSRIHQRAARNHPLSDAQAKANRNRSKFRARV
jgi:hypothetical protein